VYLVEYYLFLYLSNLYWPINKFYFKRDFGVRTPILILYVIKATILQYGMLILVPWDFTL